MPLSPLPVSLLERMGSCLGLFSPAPFPPTLHWEGARFTSCPLTTVPRTEIFSGKSVAHEDIKYEQACILYNLGELPRPFPGAPLLPALPISTEDTWILTHPCLPSALPASWAAGSPQVGEACKAAALGLDTPSPPATPFVAQLCFWREEA